VVGLDESLGMGKVVLVWNDFGGLDLAGDLK
jgi:hypothetical protein